MANQNYAVLLNCEEVDMRVEVDNLETAALLLNGMVEIHFEKKENKKSNREPKNKHKVPTTRSNRFPKNLLSNNTIPNQIALSNSAFRSSLESLRSTKSSKLVTSTPKDGVSTSYPKSSVATFIRKNAAVLKGGVAADKPYSSYEDLDFLETKEIEVEQNKRERNNNIEKKILGKNVDRKIAATVEKLVYKPSKNLERNTVSKELKVVKRNEILQTDKKGGVSERNKVYGGLLVVKKKERSIIGRGGDGKIERDKIRQQSTLTLNLARSRPKLNQRLDAEKPRPISVPNARSCARSLNFKRGHAKDSAGRDTDNISRTSSVTNLESLESQGRSKPPKKIGSKERVDKDGKKGAPKTNNNQTSQGVALAPVQVDPKAEAGFHSYSSDSLQDAEIQQLRRQLKEMADEKSSLALQLGEQRGQLNSLHKEIIKLKSFKDESTQEIEKLSEENTTLRNRLRNVAHSPLSDNEKHQLLFENAHMLQSSSAPASIATNIIEETGGDVTACTTPDWDKNSSGNVSEVSVACLQDKINQMQETHYSTNEELQATLQELTDLQRQLTDLQQENERLNEEKTLMFDSLCRQTERLNDSRDEVESLKQLLYRDRSDETAATQLENVVEREQKLVELLRSAQEERETLLVKLEQMQAELQESRAELKDKSTLISQLSERVKTLECSMDAKHAEHKQMDQELAQAKDQCSSKQIEINRLTDLLDNARTKINEIEQDRTLSDKSELDELLDNARKEKDQLESEVAYLKEQLARSKNELEKLKEQVFVLQEECKVTRNNAKTTQSDLEYKCEKLVSDKNTLTEQLQQFQEALNELQVQTQCHIEDKRQLSAVLSETQRNLSESERKSLNLDTELQELKKLRSEENDEWEKFQNDLLTSVRVANDFKTEAQQELQKIILENKTYREKVRLLEGQLEKIKGGKTTIETQTEVVLTPQLIHLAKNFEFPPAILREEPKRRHKKVVSLDSVNMDKLFPALSRDRRAKSKENLDDLRNSRESLNKNTNTIKAGTSRDNLNSSRDDLRKSQESLHKESKKNRFKLFRGKSSENLTNSEKEYDQELENKEKLKKSKFKLGKSIENLTNFEKEIHKDLKKPESDQKDVKPVEKFRKKSKDSIDSLSSSGTLDKKSSDFFSRFVKRREKKTPNRNKTQNPKFMSVEEELLMKSLDNWYDNIDKTVPEELLSKEDKAIKKLKVLYENDQVKERPIAKKPKEQLAISKPLLTSVVQNPQLEEIVKNSDFTNVEEPLRDSVLEFAENSSIIQPSLAPERSRIKSDGASKLHDKKWFGFYKSKSLDDLNYLDVDDVTDPYGLKLYRTTETENLNANDESLLKSPKFELHRYSSEIEAFDSVSNPRHSGRYPEENVFLPEAINMELKNEISLNDKCIGYPEGESPNPKHPDSVFLETFPHKYEPKTGNDLPKPNIYINYENLDQIVAEIPKNVPESSLSEEQKFALKLKLAFDFAEKKTAIKKRKKKSLKYLEISSPTRESVEKNWKLKKIILNPHITSVQNANKRFSDFDVDLDSPHEETRRHSANIDESFEMIDDFSTRKNAQRSSSKSYQTIQFSFAPENHILNMFYPKQNATNLTDLGIKTKSIESDSSNSSYSYTSGEFNLDTGDVSKKSDENLLREDVNIQIENITDVASKEKINESSSEELKQEASIDNNLNVPMTAIKNQSLDSEDLFYNETLSKKEKCESFESAADDLGYNETLVKKVGPKTTKIKSIKQDPRIEEAEKQYKKNLQEILHRIDIEEKIKPFLHPRVPKHKAQFLHVHYQEPESVVTRCDKEEAIISYNTVTNCTTGSQNNGENLNNTANISMVDHNDSFLSYRSSDVSKFLDSLSDSLVLPDSFRDFIHSSGYADQESRNNFIELSNCNISLGTFLEEERSSTDLNAAFDAGNKNVVDKIQPSLNNLDFQKNLALNEEVDVAEQDPDQYTHHEMEKENKYGVVSPYEVRHSYKNVVTEIKRKFSSDDFVVPEYLKEGQAFEGNEKKKTDTFMNKFFNLHTESDNQNYEAATTDENVLEEGEIRYNEEDVVNLRIAELSEIDKEMHEIMEKYLHTRESLIVKKNFNNEPRKDYSLNTYDINDRVSMLKKYENVENLQKIKISESKDFVPDFYGKNSNDTVSKDDLKFIEEKDETQKDHIVLTEQEIEEKYQKLTQQELDLINSVKRDRFSRPLSGINENDLFLVEEISKRYFDEDSCSDSPKSTIVDNKEKPFKVKNNSSEVVCPGNINMIETSGLLEVKDLPELAKMAQEGQMPATVLEPTELKESVMIEKVTPKILSQKKCSNINQIKLKTLHLNSDLNNSMSFLQSLSRLSPLTDQETNFTRIKSSQEFRTSSLKQSLIPLSTTKFGSLPPNVRRNKINKSLGSHFQRRSLEEGLSYQSVYGSKSKPFEEGKLKINAKADEISTGQLNNINPKDKNDENILNKPLCIKVLFEKAEAANANKSEPKRLESTKTEKKPIPRPRIKSQASFSGLNDLLMETENTSPLPCCKSDNKQSTDIDNNENVINMINNNKNSSIEVKACPENEDVSSLKENTVVEELQGVPKEFEKCEIVQAKVVYLDNTESIIDLVPEQVIQKIYPCQELQELEAARKSNENPLKTPKPEKFFEQKNEIVSNMSDEGNANSSQGSLPSKSSIKILGKREELDISQNRSNSEEVEEVPRSNSSVEPSHVNLFKLESENSYDSYLELFKSEADKKFDNITGKQHSEKGFIKFELSGEELSDDSYTAADSKMSVTESAPKIVDFVPLDDQTKKYFTNEGVVSVSSTLERENTFQVLNQAKSMADTLTTKELEGSKKVDKIPPNIDHHDLNSSLEVLAKTPSNFSKGSSKSQTDASRSSFSNAKKLFEALVEAHKTDEKPKPKTPPKYQVRDGKSSETNIAIKERVGGSRNIVRETVLLIKDEKSVPTETRSSKNIVRETVLVANDVKNVPLDPENQK